MAFLCMGGFIKQALIRNLLCILVCPYQKLSILCVLQASYSYIWEILLFFPAKSGFGLLCYGYFVKFHLFSHKIHMFHVKYTSILYYVCVLPNHCIKLNFMPVVCLLSKLLFCGIFMSKCQILCYMQCLAFLFNNKCVLLEENSHSL